VQSIPPSPASRSAYRHPPSHPLHPINMAEFMFVNLNNPTQNKRREVRKLVRSHVSYMQHSQKRTELGQVQKPSKSRYTDRSVNGWAVLDDSIAARSSQLKVDSASGLNSGLLPQHQSTVPGSVQVRLPRQMYDKELQRLARVDAVQDKVRANRKPLLRRRLHQSLVTKSMPSRSHHSRCQHCPL
jgi:hypothetical protein